MNSLADSSNIGHCKSMEDEEMIVPESFNWTEKYPQCARPVLASGNCSASYAMATLSAVSDRICQANNRTVTLSSQEIIDCDKTNYHCDGGYVTRVLNWGKRKGFLPEDCRPYSGAKGNCTDEFDYTEDECRRNNTLYRIIDYCLAQDETSIKKEILKNGPLIS